MDFRERVGAHRFVDVSFAELQTNPTATLETSYAQLGLTLSEAGRARVQEWPMGISRDRAMSTATTWQTTA